MNIKSISNKYSMTSIICIFRYQSAGSDVIESGFGTTLPPILSILHDPDLNYFTPRYWPSRPGQIKHKQ